MFKDGIKTLLEHNDYVSWFWYMFIGIVVVTTILLCVFFKKSKDKIFRAIIFIFWIIIVLFELYKQYFWTIELNNGVYDTNFIPYQFCSLSLYVYPFITFGKESKFRDVAIVFSGIFIFFAGLIIYILPGMVENFYLIMDIHTMVHHGVQIIVGVFLIVHEFNKFTFKNFLYSLLFLLGTILLAVLLNETLYYAMPTDFAKSHFNLFYISSHNYTGIPYLQQIKEISFVLSIIVYSVVFSIAGFIVYGITMGISKLTSLLKKH